ncbi:MAG: hypothetical protein P4L84_00470 [Isosphaeraceae bacterium]|nr:hypothetical protein [Isosphaeraceae bacterium]
MMHEMNCPHCNAKVRSEEQFTEGTTMACPFCKTTFRLVAVGDAGLSKRGEPSPLPPRAPAAKGTGPKRLQPTGAIPAIQHSRKTIGTVILLSIAGLAALFVTWYVDTVRSLTKTADRASKQRVERLVHGAEQGAVKKKSAPVPQALVVRSFESASMEIDNIVVGVSAAEIGRVRINKQESANNYLILRIQITNRSQDTIAYQGWQRSDVAVVLRDVTRKTYERASFSPGELPEGCVEESKIAAGETLRDNLVFEAPSPPYRSLELELPLSETSTFRLAVADSMIRAAKPVASLVVRPLPGAASATSAQPAGAPGASLSDAFSGKPAQAEKAAAKPSRADELALRRTILAEYRELWAQVERRSKGMAYDRGRQYKRSRRTEILNSMSEKYKMPVDDLRGILP